MDELFSRAAGAAGTLVSLLAVIAAAGFAVLAWRLLRHPPSRAVGHTARDLALACALALIVALTLLSPTPIGDGLRPQLRLIPFVDLQDALSGTRSLRLAVAEIVGNVLLFVPFGMALRWRAPALGVVGVGVVSLLLSVGIELLQGVTGGGRWPDSTDVITNTVGGLVGAAVAGIGAATRRA